MKYYSQTQNVFIKEKKISNNFKRIFLETTFSKIAAVITHEKINKSTSNLIGILSTYFVIQ